MPLRFWKKEKGKKKDEEAEAEAERETKAAAPGARPEPKAPRAEPTPAVPTVDAVHATLVELGLTVPATKAVFEKRVAAQPGGMDGFLKEYGSQAHRAVTRVLSEWLGFGVPEPFEPDDLLRDVNARLSAFKLSIDARDLTWLDKDLNLRKARLALGEQEKVVRFKDARDFVRGINELLAPKHLAFLELETWGESFSFLLVREPKWEKLAATDLVVVKSDQTATGGECGECGAPVGKYWSDCPKCGAVFR